MSLVLRSNKGSKLTIEELDGNFTYLESHGGGSAFRLLTNANDGETMLTSDQSLFISQSDYTTITFNMPDPSVMGGKTLFFLRTDGGSENTTVISGIFNNNPSPTTYNLYGWSNNGVRFISNGVYWYDITN